MSWKNVALGDVCKVIAGQSPESINYNKEGRGLAFYQGKKDFGDVYVNPPTVWTTEITKEAIKNDILMSVRAPVGPVNIATEHICIGRGLAAIRATERINQAYLFYYLLKIEKELVGNAGAVFNSINKTQIENLLVPLPSIPTQQKIVAKLDAIFAEIDTATAAAEANARNAELLFQSYLSNIQAPLSTLDKHVTIKTGKLDSNASVGNGKYPFFTCSKEIFSINDYAFDCEAVLLAGNNASGDFNVKHYEGKFNAYQRTYVITINDLDKITYRYLYFQLVNALKQFKSISVGANTKFLKIGMIKELKFPLPNMNEQIKILNKLSVVEFNKELLKKNYIKKKYYTNLLKQSILQKAFSGELVKD